MPTHLLRVTKTAPARSMLDTEKVSGCYGAAKKKKQMESAKAKSTGKAGQQSGNENVGESDGITSYVCGPCGREGELDF